MSHAQSLVRSYIWRLKKNSWCAIVISDTVKPEAKRAIASFKQSGVRKVQLCLPADRKDVGEAVAESLGIDEVYTDLLPAIR